MKLAQLVPRLHRGDAIGDNAIAIRDLGKHLGFDSRIFYLDCDNDALLDGEPIGHYHRWCDRSTTSILHYALPSSLSHVFSDSPGRRFLLYHNITPPIHLLGYPLYQKIAMAGRAELASMRNTCDKAFADSEFNRDELDRMGFRNTEVIPIYLDFDRYRIPSDPVLERMFEDDFANVLYVGRITPNKCQHDLIRLFSVFKHYVHPKSRLVLIGKYDGFETYYTQLVKLAVQLGIGDVYMPGKVSQQELVTWYRKAAIFVSMSEHEGFCVPLVESLHFRVPVLAFAAGAVPGVLAGTGVLFHDKHDRVLLAETMEQMIADIDLRASLIEHQTQRLADLSQESVFRLWNQALSG